MSHWFEHKGECHLPEREVITGIGAMVVKVPRERDRSTEPEKLGLTSTILRP